MLLFASALLFFLFIVVGSVIGLFTNYYHDFKIKSLDKVNLSLKSQLKEMKEKYHGVQYWPEETIMIFEIKPAKPKPVEVVKRWEIE